MGSIFCIGQSAYDITIPLDGAICENQKYRVTQKKNVEADLDLMLHICVQCREKK